VTAAIEVTSRTIRGTLVNIEGRTVGEYSLAIEEDQAEQANVMAAFKAVAHDILGQRPAGAAIPGIGISLPGIVDERGLTWISAARWPRMTNLDFHGLAEETGLAVRIERKRQSELRAHFQTHPEERSGGTLFVSWGYGISSAYAQNGTVLTSAMGGFGDLGHWLVEPESGRKCLCGQTGCLEAHAALWALMPEIRKAFPDIGTHPPTIRALLQSRDISHLAPSSTPRGCSRSRCTTCSRRSFRTASCCPAIFRKTLDFRAGAPALLRKHAALRAGRVILESRTPTPTTPSSEWRRRSSWKACARSWSPRRPHLRAPIRLPSRGGATAE